MILTLRRSAHAQAEHATHFLKGFLNFDILIEKYNRNWSYVWKLMFGRKFSSNFNKFFFVKNITITNQVKKFGENF